MAELAYAPVGDATRAPQVARRRYSEDAAKLWQQWERRRDGLRNWKEIWQLLADYLDPNRTQFTKGSILNTGGGEKRTQQLFDSTAPHACDLFAADIHGAVASPAQKFFSMQARQRELNDVAHVRQWNEETADRTYLGFSNSNFITEHAEMFKDLTVFCTGTVMLEEARRMRPGIFGGFRFKGIPLGTYVIDEDADGRVDLLDRLIIMSARAAVERWGELAGERICKLAEQRPEEDVEIIHAVHPRADYNPRKLDKGNMPYASCFYTVQDKHKIGEGGYREFPYFCVRWSKAAGEKWGRGPSWIALPDIRTLNRHIELYLGAGAKAVDPPLLEIYDSIMGPVSLEPAAITTIKEKGALEALESKTRWDVAEALSDRLDRKISQIFFVDLFDTPPAGKGFATATEVAIRNDRRLRLLGPAGGRLHFDWLQPMVGRAVALQYRAGVLDDPPEELQSDDVDIDVIAEGALARAQRSPDVLAIESTYGAVGMMVEATGDPSIWDSFIHDENAREIATVRGMPATGLRDQDGIAQIRAARAQKMAAEAKLGVIAQGAESLGKAAPGLKVLAENAGPNGQEAA